MKLVKIVTFSFFIFLLSVQSNDKFFSIKPHFGLLTSSYGVVTSDDLAKDESRKVLPPYNPNDPIGPLRWQCFLKGELDARFDSWQGPDGMAESNKIYKMCSLEIDVRHHGELQVYVDRRGHQIDFCLDFIQEWKVLTGGESVVCLNGEGGGYEQDEKYGKYKLWTWEKFKTKKGCYSYFEGECDVTGCAGGECPHSDDWFDFYPFKVL